ncbi:PIN domain-containing protein [Dyadobacter subterraneus]|uniref:PIN domain-containing protein n=1 Tax=Dyadobacter subterraneus TaxID=2773304 RepID=A0ABR9WEE6_9BACT|nr:PIN domain-containing protein [Dyadobacter subterraneus]MBE9463494.1 PIN domain-containing protein [Dyadobacter subterraneus]
MYYHGHQVAVLDACVLYPAPIRDLLLHLAGVGLFSPRWSLLIHEEWIRNLLLNRPDINPDQLQRTRIAMDKAFPDANVTNFDLLTEKLDLPDKNDNHILSAAILGEADIIVTANLKDFPNLYLSMFDVKAQHPDIFISNLITSMPEMGIAAFKNQVSFLKKPPMTEKEVLASLKAAGLE